MVWLFIPPRCDDIYIYMLYLALAYSYSMIYLYLSLTYSYSTLVTYRLYVNQFGGIFRTPFFKRDINTSVVLTALPLAHIRPYVKRIISYHVYNQTLVNRTDAPLKALIFMPGFLLF